mgnify:CR=1 FL=1
MANASSELATQQDGATRLNGWKDIATYLGRGIRTVQRWEKTSGLPVRRLKHGPGESVFAFTHEIDLWQMTADAASARAAAMAADEGDASRHHRNGHAAGETSAARSDADRLSDSGGGWRCLRCWCWSCLPSPGSPGSGYPENTLPGRVVPIHERVRLHPSEQNGEQRNARILSSEQGRFRRTRI